jgi:hypothetical protein
MIRQVVRALWDPGWYNLDQSLITGGRDTFVFLPDASEQHPGYDLVFANTVGVDVDWAYREATVSAIEHARWGAVQEVDASRFGEYTFRFVGGRWVTIEAEEGPGSVNAASPDFPVGECDREWATTSGWALAVTLVDVTKAERPRRSRRPR